MNLIHIGMPKAGSTSLQNFWSKSEQINLVWQDLEPLVNRVRKSIRSQEDPNQLLKLWPTKNGLNTEGKAINIFSSEGLFGLPLSQRFTKDEVDYSRYLYANICREFLPESKILILIRNPFDWLKSIYIQSIQEGRNWGFVKFINVESDAILEHFNLCALVAHWSEAFGEQNIIIYPFEKLCVKPTEANNELCRAISLHEQHIFSLQKQANRSISIEQAYLLRALSVLNRSVAKYDSSLKSSFEKLNKEMRLLYRVALQKSGSTALHNRIEVPNRLPRLPASIREKLTHQLQQNFFPALCASQFDAPTLASYQEQVNRHFD